MLPAGDRYLVAIGPSTARRLRLIAAAYLPSGVVELDDRERSLLSAILQLGYVYLC